MKKMDEMDRNIRLRSEAYGFKCAVLLLAAWTLYESYTALSTGKLLNILPSLLLTGSLAVQGFSELYMKRKMIAGDEEYREPNKVLWTAVLAIAVTAVVLSAGCLFFLSRS